MKKKNIAGMFKDQNDKEKVKEFLGKLETAYKNAGVYIQNNYAVDNFLLVSLSSLDPLIRGHTIVVI